MICTKAHCGDCNHKCVNSPVFNPTQEERIQILLKDDLIISKNLNNSGLIMLSSE